MANGKDEVKQSEEQPDFKQQIEHGVKLNHIMSNEEIEGLSDEEIKGFISKMKNFNKDDKIKFDLLKRKLDMGDDVENERFKSVLEVCTNEQIAELYEYAKDDEELKPIFFDFLKSKGVFTNKGIARSDSQETLSKGVFTNKGIARSDSQETLSNELSRSSSKETLSDGLSRLSYADTVVGNEEDILKTPLTRQKSEDTYESMRNKEKSGKAEPEVKDKKGLINDDDLVEQIKKLKKVEKKEKEKTGLENDDSLVQKMANVISKQGDDEEKFEIEGASLKDIRDKYNKLDEEEKIVFLERVKEVIEDYELGDWDDWKDKDDVKEFVENPVIENEVDINNQVYDLESSVEQEEKQKSILDEDEFKGIIESLKEKIEEVNDKIEVHTKVLDSGKLSEDLFQKGKDELNRLLREKDEYEELLKEQLSSLEQQSEDKRVSKKEDAEVNIIKEVGTYDSMIKDGRRADEIKAKLADGTIKKTTPAPKVPKVENDKDSSIHEYKHSEIPGGEEVKHKVEPEAKKAVVYDEIPGGDVSKTVVEPIKPQYVEHTKEDHLKDFEGIDKAKTKLKDSVVKLAEEMSKLNKVSNKEKQVSDKITNEERIGEKRFRELKQIFEDGSKKVTPNKNDKVSKEADLMVQGEKEYINKDIEHNVDLKVEKAPEPQFVQNIDDTKTKLENLANNLVKETDKILNNNGVNSNTDTEIDNEQPTVEEATLIPFEQNDIITSREVPQEDEEIYLDAGVDDGLDNELDDELDVTQSHDKEVKEYENDSRDLDDSKSKGNETYLQKKCSREKFKVDKQREGLKLAALFRDALGGEEALKAQGIKGINVMYHNGKFTVQLEGKGKQLETYELTEDQAKKFIYGKEEDREAIYEEIRGLKSEQKSKMHMKNVAKATSKNYDEVQEKLSKYSSGLAYMHGELEGVTIAKKHWYSFSKTTYKDGEKLDKVIEDGEKLNELKDIVYRAKNIGNKLVRGNKKAIREMYSGRVEEKVETISMTKEDNSKENSGLDVNIYEKQRDIEKNVGTNKESRMDLLSKMGKKLGGQNKDTKTNSQNGIEVNILQTKKEDKDGQKEKGREM